MKYIQTFWPEPQRMSKGDRYGFTGGWLSAEYHWMSWALSALQAAKVLGEVELITTSEGRDLLCGVLGLPYARVSTALDDLPADYPSGLWSMAKLYSYRMQNEPFLHLDGDLILWRRPAEDWLRAPLLCQNIEKEFFFYRPTLDRINETFSYLPVPFERSCYAGREIYSCNAGLFGGSAIGLIQEYCGMAFEFLEKNRQQLRGVAAGDLNFIYEQYLFYWLAKERGVPVAPFLPEMVEDPLYRELIRFQDIPPAPLIHPVGGFKKLQWVCNSVARCLREEYPDYYYRIIDMVKEAGVPMRSKVYMMQGMDTDVREGYERTGEALGWLYRKYGSWEKVCLETYERECLAEVYRLEAAGVSHAQLLYEEKQLVEERYEKDIEIFRSIRRLFSLSSEERLSRRIWCNPDALWVAVDRKWVNDKSNRMADIISLNFGCGEDVQRVASGWVMIVPAVLQLSVTEYYLDELDGLIADVCKDAHTIGEIIAELEDCFDREELDADYLAYTRLIEECLKRLLFAGVLVTSEN